MATSLRRLVVGAIQYQYRHFISQSRLQQKALVCSLQFPPPYISYSSTACLLSQTPLKSTNTSPLPDLDDTIIDNNSDSVEGPSSSMQTSSDDDRQDVQTVADTPPSLDGTKEVQTVAGTPPSLDGKRDLQMVAHTPLLDSVKAPSSHESASFMHDPVALKCINIMMKDGKKNISQRILREALEYVKRTQLANKKTEGVVVDPLKIFHQAVDNVKPIMGTRSLKRGGTTYQVPFALPPQRQLFLSIKWIVSAAKDRSGNGMARKLAIELLDAYSNQGTAMKKKQDLHRLAEANRAYAQFRW